MAFNGSGVFSRLYNWVTEQASSPIEISKLDAQESDIAAGLSNCILRDGTGVPTSATPWNSQNLTGVGALTAVSGTFSSTVTATGAITASALIPSSSTVPANGVYLPAANTVGIATNSSLRFSLDANGLGIGSAMSLGNASKSGTDRMVEVSSATNGDIVGFQAFVNEGANARRAMLWVDDTAGTFGLTGTASSGVPDFKLEIGAITPLSINSSGNVTVAAPSSGTPLTVSGIDAAVIAAFLDTTSTNGVYMRMGDSVGSRGYMGFGSSTFSGAAISDFGIAAASGVLRLSANGGTNTHMQIASAGNVTINAASSGDELTVTGSVVATSFAGDGSGLTSLSATQLTSGTVPDARFPATLPTVSGANLTALNATQLTSGTVPDARFPATLPAASGVNLTALNASNLASGTVPAARIGSSTDYAIGDGSTVNSIQIGFRGIPQNAQTGNYTCVLADAGKHIYHAAGAGSGDTYTIPANGSVAYAIGTAITFINRDTTNSVSIAITTDTLTMAVTGSTGTRTLAPYGTATAIKITSTEWLISGSGLT